MKRGKERRRPSTGREVRVGTESGDVIGVQWLYRTDKHDCV